MKKKVIVIVAALVGMSFLLVTLDFLLDTWTSSDFVGKAIRILALMGWVWITYNMITLKYKWIRRLAE